MHKITERKVLALKFIGSLFGWIWMFSIPISIALSIYAAFFDGQWKYVFLSFLAGALGKSLLRGFNDHSERIIIRNYLVTKGIPEDLAQDMWYEAYKLGGAEGARQLFQLDDEVIEQLSQT